MTRDMLYLQCCPTDTRQREEVKSIWRILLFLFLSAIKNKKKPPVFALLRASFFLSTWTCYFFSPTGIIAYADQEINMQVILKHSETNKKLLFTHHCPARCFGMNMPKSRDIQAKIPLPQANWNEFWLRYCERSEQ